MRTQFSGAVLGAILVMLSGPAVAAPKFDEWATLKNEIPGWQILFIGDGPRRAHLEQRVDELGMRDSVYLVGNQDNVPEWLACIDLFVLPSYGEEGVPQGLMQAMACGKPAISTPIGAIGEALQDGQTGLMTPPKDVPKLTELTKITRKQQKIMAQKEMSLRIDKL